MKTSASTFWDFGSIPMIEPEFLGNILATSSDIAVMIDLRAQLNQCSLIKANSIMVIIPLGR